jgi:RES domain-containing protein
MEVFRLSREKFTHHLSGTGASLKGARWNSVGVRLVYTAGNRSLAMSEVAVQFTLATLPGDYVMLVIHIPDDLMIRYLNPKMLPEGWNRFPHLLYTQTIGNEFVNSGKECILRVPSSVTQGDYNFLLNPDHPDFRKIKIIDQQKFPFDHRMFR